MERRATAVMSENIIQAKTYAYSKFRSNAASMRAVYFSGGSPGYSSRSSKPCCCPCPCPPDAQTLKNELNNGIEHHLTTMDQSLKPRFQELQR